MESSLFRFQTDLFGPLKASLKWAESVECETHAIGEDTCLVLHVRFKLCFACLKNAII